MKIIDSIPEMQELSRRRNGKIGFVPTMGYLHEGHLSLVRESRILADKTVVSIFVNPTQFGENEDLDKYPRNPERDIRLLKELQVDYLFFPKKEDLYPQNYKTRVEVSEITGILCGKSRPTHFRGVTTIVSKLLNIIDPDLIFLGEKDFQQLVVLRRMIKDLNFRTEVIGCPIVRDENGLALSSRNKYLSESEYKNSLSLSRSLKEAQKRFDSGKDDSDILTKEIRKEISANNGKIDYVQIVDSQILQKVSKVKKGNRILTAAFFGSTRLIDNIEIK